MKTGSHAWDTEVQLVLNFLDDSAIYGELVDQVMPTTFKPLINQSLWYIDDFFEPCSITENKHMSSDYLLGNLQNKEINRVAFLGHIILYRFDLLPRSECRI